MMDQTKHSIRGFTLVEMVVVMTVFIFILIVTASAFKTILTKSRVTFGSEESNIEGVVGLEMLRHDLQQTGFGLFTDESSAPDYAEAVNAPFSAYNDAGAVPRALVTDNNVNLGNNATILTGTDYLAIKATTVGRTKTSQLWSYITDTGAPKRWKASDFEDRVDKLIAVVQRYDTSKKQIYRRLLRNSANNYAFTYYASGDFRDMNGKTVSDYRPTTSQIYYLYGIYRDSSPEFTLGAPFNRTDYFIKRIVGSTPTSCSPSTGVLYKTTMNHSDGSFNEIPVLDCVADMQIALGWNTDPDPENHPEPSAFSDADGTAVSGNLNGLSIADIMLSAEEVRRRLRLIKVYILAQDGGRDLNFTNTNNAMVVGDPDLGEAALTKTVDLTQPNMRNYRWKRYGIVVRPKNL